MIYLRECQSNSGKPLGKCHEMSFMFHVFNRGTFSLVIAPHRLDVYVCTISSLFNGADASVTIMIYSLTLFPSHFCYSVAFLSIQQLFYFIQVEKQGMHDNICTSSVSADRGFRTELSE